MDCRIVLGSLAVINEEKSKIKEIFWGGRKKIRDNREYSMKDWQRPFSQPNSNQVPKSMNARIGRQFTVASALFLSIAMSTHAFAEEIRSPEISPSLEHMFPKNGIDGAFGMSAEYFRPFSDRLAFDLYGRYTHGFSADHYLYEGRGWWSSFSQSETRWTIGASLDWFWTGMDNLLNPYVGIGVNYDKWEIDGDSSWGKNSRTLRRYSDDVTHSGICGTGRIGLEIFQHTPWYYRFEAAYQTESKDDGYAFSESQWDCSALVGYQYNENLRINVKGDYWTDSKLWCIGVGVTYCLGPRPSASDLPVVPKAQDLAGRYLEWQESRPELKVVDSIIPLLPKLIGDFYIGRANASDKAFARNQGYRIFTEAFPDYEEAIKGGKSPQAALDSIFVGNPDDRKLFCEYAKYAQGMDYDALCKENEDAEQESDKNKAELSKFEVKAWVYEHVEKEYGVPAPKGDLEVLKWAAALKEKNVDGKKLMTDVGNAVKTLGKQLDGSLKAISFKRDLDKQDKAAQDLLKGIPIEG